MKRLLTKIKRHPKAKSIYKGIFKLIGCLPVKKNVVIFESFHGKQYSCNPRAIYEYLSSNHPEYKMYWSVDKRYAKTFEESHVPIIKRFSFRWFSLMPRAQYWVINSRLPLWMPKPKHTTYLQTWHGTPLKKLAEDIDEVHMPEVTTEVYKENFKIATRKWDYLISPNAYSTKIFRRAFQFDKEIIESGYPRNDFLYKENNEQTIKKIKEKCGLPLDKKVLLYAPTWRDDQFYAKGRYKFDLDLDLHKMQKQLGHDYIIVLRMHYLVSENFDLSPFQGFAYDFSHHEDIRELYLISDLLITDYSSVFFDYANLYRPMIFFVYDIEHYRDKLRGFYFDFEKEAPGPLVKTTDEVIDVIFDIEKNNFKCPDNFKHFHHRFCYLEDGEASRRVVERVFLGRIPT